MPARTLFALLVWSLAPMTRPAAQQAVVVRAARMVDVRVLEQVPWVMKGGAVVKGAGKQESGEAGK
jgi:hypothetical protein